MEFQQLGNGNMSVSGYAKKFKDMLPTLDRLSMHLMRDGILANSSLVLGMILSIVCRRGTSLPIQSY